MTKRILAGVAALVICFFLAGCDFEVKDKTYTSSGLTVTMEDGMFEKDLASATVYYEGTSVIMSGLKETFDALSVVNLGKESTIADYIKVVEKNNGSTFDVKEEDGITYFTYEKEISGKSFFYLASVYKTDDAFWLVNFGCETKNKDKYEQKFIKWAKTVKFE